jgi:uncharacterized membrane protein
VVFLFLLINASVTAPSLAQSEDGYTSESLFIDLKPNGDALVQYDVGIKNPLAQETRISLFANSSVGNLIVVDYEDNVIEYDFGDTPNEIVLKTPGASSATISYSTQDMVNKIQGRWIFSLMSISTGATIKLPADSVLVEFGENFPTIKDLGDQQVLTFNPGNIEFAYVIGVLGTEEQANIVIRLAQSTIKEAGDTHPGIVLTEANDLLRNATEARDGGKFSEAEMLAGQANEAAVTTTKGYDEAKKAIESADTEIRQAASEARDTAAASQLLEQANTEFQNGEYVNAKASAEDAVGAIGGKPPVPGLPLFVIVAAAVAAGGGVGAMVFLRARRPRQVVLHKRMEDKPSIPKEGNNTPVPGSPVAELDNSIPKPELSNEAIPGVPNLKQEPSLAAPSTIPESQIDKSILSRFVTRIVEEKPHLRPEDQEVLRYLAEQEGAAFESELRTRFQLPKTTIWRLVKRLEREELVEIRKAGGQNLIKLRFEDRQQYGA